MICGWRGWVSPLQHQAQLEAIAALTAAERARAERAEQHHVPDHGDPVPVRRHDSAGDQDVAPVGDLHGLMYAPLDEQDGHAGAGE